MQVLAPDVVSFAGLTFSPDGNYVYFVRSDKSTTNFRYLYVMPVLGGTPRQLIRDIDSPLSFSPDGKQFAFMRGVPERNDVEVRVASTDGSNDHLLAALPDWPGFMFGAAWSPDGKTILAPGLQMAKEIKWVLNAINVADGAVKDLISGSAGLGRPAWSPDGNSFLILNRARSLRIARNCGWFPIPAANEPAFPTIFPITVTSLEMTQDGKMLVALAAQRERAHLDRARGQKPRKPNKLPPAKLPTTASRPAPPAKLLVRSRGSDLAADERRRQPARPAASESSQLHFHVSLRRSLPGLRFLRGK